MSEAMSIAEHKAEPAEVVVDLGTATEKTRGSVTIFGLLDGGLYWPFLFVYH